MPVITTVSLSKTLRDLFTINGHVLNANANGFTQDSSIVQPQPNGNCANWVLAHVVHYRKQLLDMLNVEPKFDAELTAQFGRNAAPVTGARDALDWSALLRDFAVSQDQLIKALESASDESLSQPCGEETLGTNIAQLYFHETYHLGQLGLLRRIVGLDGAIK